MSKPEETAEADEAAEAAEPSWPRVLTLQHPVDFGKRRIETLTFRRGKVGDARGIKLRDEIPVDDLLKIASHMCGEPVAALAMLDIDDGGEVTAIAMDFYVKFLGAGKKR